MMRTQRRELVLHGVVTPLGGRAFDLLQVLIERRDRVVSTREIFSLVWPGLAVQPNNLQVQIWTLRGLLGFTTIATVARRGYQFAAEVEVLPDDEPAPGPDRPALHAPSAVDPAGGAWSIETAAVCAELVAHRLVTLVGPDDHSRRGLAMSVTRHLLNHQSGGIWYLDAPWLAQASDERSDADVERFIRRIGTRNALIVVLDAHRAVDTVRGLLASLPPRHKSKVLATSREALHLDGERVLQAPRRLDPVPVPAERTPARAGLRWRTR